MPRYDYEVQLHNWMGEPVVRPFFYTTGKNATEHAKQWLIQAGYVKYVRIFRRKCDTYEYTPWKVVWFCYSDKKIRTSKRKDILTK